MRYFKIVLFILLTLSSFSAFAASENDGVLVRARVVYDVPESVELSAIQQSLKSVASKYADKFSEFKGVLPDDLPAVAAEAKNTQTAATVDFDDSVYAIRAYKTSSFLGGSYAQVYITTVYVYEGGYKVYLYTYFKTQYNFLGSIGRAIADAAMDISIDSGFEDTIIARDVILHTIPDAKIYRQSPAILSEYVYKDKKIQSTKKPQPLVPNWVRSVESQDTGVVIESE